MDSIAFREYKEFVGCLPMSDFLLEEREAGQLSKANQSATPVAARASGLGSRVLDNVKSLFQRSLAHITDFVTSAIGRVRISRALIPFIKKVKQENPYIDQAKGETSEPIKEEHFEKLQSALSFAVGNNRRTAKSATETVLDNVQSLDLKAIRRLKCLFDERIKSGAEMDENLISTIDLCVQDAVAKEAKRNLGEVLKRFSKYSAGIFDTNVAVPAMQHDLATIQVLVRPQGGSAVGVSIDYSLCDGFELTSIITPDALKIWFDGHSPRQQSRIKINLWATAFDVVSPSDEMDPNVLMYKFCRSVTTVLWPQDNRHASFSNLDQSFGVARISP